MAVPRPDARPMAAQNNHARQLTTQTKIIPITSFYLEIYRISTIFAPFFSWKKERMVHFDDFFQLKQQYISAGFQRVLFGSGIGFSRGLTIGFALF